MLDAEDSVVPDSETNLAIVIPVQCNGLGSRKQRPSLRSAGNREGGRSDKTTQGYIDSRDGAPHV